MTDMSAVQALGGDEIVTIDDLAGLTGDRQAFQGAPGQTPGTESQPIPTVSLG